MIASLAQTLAWASVTALPLIFIALVVGRLRVSAKLKVWTCRLAYLKLLLGLIPVGLAIGAAPVAGVLSSSGRNTQLDLFLIVLTSLWAAGFLVVVYDLGKAYRTSRHLIRQSRSTGSASLSSLSRRAGMPCPEVRQAETDGLPFASGIIRPVVVIPTKPCPDSVLAHELAHIRARDLAWNLLARVTLAIFWFTPCIHRLERELNLWQEATADAEACRITACPLKEHANAIVTSVARPPSVLVWEAGLSGNAEIVSRRISALYQDRTSPMVALVSLAFLAITLIPIQAQAIEKSPNDAVRARVIPNAFGPAAAAAPIASKVD